MHRPTERILSKVVKNFVKTEKVWYGVRHSFTRDVAEYLELSVRRCQQLLGLSYGFIWRILHIKFR